MFLYNKMKLHGSCYIFKVSFNYSWHCVGLVNLIICVICKRKSFNYQLWNANPVLIFQTRVYGFDRIQTRVTGFDIWWVTCQWQTCKSCRAYYKQLRGGQMEVWLARYRDDLRRSVPVLQKHQLKQHHMSTTSTS